MQFDDDGSSSSSSTTGDDSGGGGGGSSSDDSSEPSSRSRRSRVTTAPQQRKFAVVGLGSDSDSDSDSDSGDEPDNSSEAMMQHLKKLEKRVEEKHDVKAVKQLTGMIERLKQSIAKSLAAKRGACARDARESHSALVAETAAAVQCLEQHYAELEELNTEYLVEHDRLVAEKRAAAANVVACADKLTDFSRKRKRQVQIDAKACRAAFADGEEKVERKNKKRLKKFEKQVSSMSSRGLGVFL